MSEIAEAARVPLAEAHPKAGAWHGIWPWLAVAAALLALPHVLTSGTALTMMSLMGIMVIFALSYNMLLGQTGMLSFGHAVYYGLGAYVAMHVMNALIAARAPVPLAVMPIVGGLAGLGFGILFGLVSTRRAGTAFAMISLGLAELVASSANVLRSFFGGEAGITTNRTKMLRVFDLSFGPQIQVYYLIAAWCLLSMLLMYGLTRTPFGRMCNAVRENPERVQFVGYDPQVVRLIAFSLSAFFAGIAGSLAAINFEIVNASYAGLAQSGTVLLAAYIGGIGYFAGPVIGAIVVTFLQTMLSDVTEIWQLYFGLLFIVIVMLAPGGIAGILAAQAPLLRGGTLGRAVPAYLLAIVPALLVVAGAIMLIEMGNHVLSKPGERAMSFVGIGVDSHGVVPWLVALALFGAGLALMRWALPRVREAWAEARAEAGSGGRP